MTDPHGRLVLELERVLAAAPERVFEMLTEPTELATWWGPRLHDAGDPARPRRRRTYRVTMQPPDGEAFHLSGDFLEVHPPDRLSFTFRWDEPDPDDRETVVVLLLAPGAPQLRCRRPWETSPPTNGSSCTATAGLRASTSSRRRSGAEAPSRGLDRDI